MGVVWFSFGLLGGALAMRRLLFRGIEKQSTDLRKSFAELQEARKRVSSQSDEVIAMYARAKETTQKFEEAVKTKACIDNCAMMQADEKS